MNFLYTITVIYLFLFFSGIGIYFILTPAFIRRPVVLLFLVPVFGLLQLSIISVYFIIANTDVTYSAFISLCVGALTLYLSYRYKNESISADFQSFKNQISRVIVTLFIAIITLIIILLPTLEGGILTTPYRIGIDQVGYTETAQFLLKGGTLKRAEVEIMHQLDTKDITAAKQNNAYALNFNAYVDSEFLLKALRWGYPAIVANLTYISGHTNVLKVAFIGLIINYALIFALAYLILNDCIQWSHGLSLIVSVALLLNCNLLNVYYEGQSAQIFGMPVFLLMLITFLWTRKNGPQFEHLRDLKLLLGKENLQLVLFLSFLTAGLLSVYNELIFTFMVFLFLVMFLDLIISRRVYMSSIVLIAVSIVIGFLLVFPYSYKWLHFIIAHLKNIGIAGWWQPKWAALSEILGISNIFANNPKMGTALMTRSKGDLLLNIVSSELILAGVLVYIAKAKDLDKPFWLAAPLFVFAIFIKNRYVDHIHNYQYMKAYTIFLPLIFIFVFASIKFCSKSKSRLIEYIVTSAGFLMILLIIINGLLYINKYDQERGYVTKDMFDLASVNQKVDMMEYALITQKLSMDEFMLTPVITLNWLNLNFCGNVPIIQPHLNKHVAILMRRKDLKCDSCVMNNYSNFILYQNPTFLIIDTKRRVSESYDDKTNKYDVNYFTKKYVGLD